MLAFCVGTQPGCGLQAAIAMALPESQGAEVPVLDTASYGHVHADAGRRSHAAAPAFEAASHHDRVPAVYDRVPAVDSASYGQADASRRSRGAAPALNAVNYSRVPAVESASYGKAHAHAGRRSRDAVPAMETASHMHANAGRRSHDDNGGSAVERDTGVRHCAQSSMAVGRCAALVCMMARAGKVFRC